MNYKKYEIECYVHTINTAIHDSAKEAGCVCKKQFKPKPYWCPQLSLIRDKKRFWWSLWVDNGRPRAGPVFNCWKGMKKLFRKVSRQCANNTLLANWSQYNDLFHQKKMSGFWNCIKRSRQNRKVKSNLSPIDIAKHFETIMKTSNDLSDEQTLIMEQVEYWSTQNQSMSDQEVSVMFTPELVAKFIKSLNRGCSPGIDGITSEHLHYGNSDILSKCLSVLYNSMLKHCCVPDIFKIHL